jgi:undecaprenyl-diphosphatase
MAVAAPMPDDAPVMNATLSVNRLAITPPINFISQYNDINFIIHTHRTLLWRTNSGMLQGVRLVRPEYIFPTTAWGNFMHIIEAIILAIVEGLTEFLPVSSTGHMILVEEYLQFGQDETFSKAFIVIIQLPAIASVVLYFWRDLWPFQSREKFRESFRLWMLVGVAFLPAAVLGLLLNDFIEDHLMNYVTVACALAVGGFVLIGLEWRAHETRMATVHDIGWGSAFLIGCFQCLAMIPGTSRSAATIIGGMALGASRSAAAEFSFFLAIPTMLGATVLTLYKHGLTYTGEQWLLIGIGSIVSFLVAYASIAFLMNFIKRHSFIPFGIYRILLGGIVLGYFLLFG